MKPPDVLTYQAGLRVRPPSTTWSPYVAAGAGAMTFMSNTDADRLPALAKSETMFAFNFGGGAQFGLSGPWALRADFREFVAFPSKDSEGFSDTNGNSDPIWMERGTVGLAYRF
jgi:opacity protein-like surface antigen